MNERRKDYLRKMNQPNKIDEHLVEISKTIDEFDEMIESHKRVLRWLNQQKAHLKKDFKQWSKK